MNTLEYNIVDILKDLKNLGCIMIKAEFEAEGTRFEELCRLKDITSAVGLPIVMKIGGCESVTDAYNCLTIGVKSIVAPMIETPFALTKYEKMIKNVMPSDNAKDIDFFFNMETITAYNNFTQMLNTPMIDMIQGVTIGRVDLAGSMNYDRSAVDGPEFFDIAKNTFTLAKTKNLITALGGAISSKSADFIKNLKNSKLLDRFETRKVVFDVSAIDNGNIIFKKALEFELEWLKSKRRYYSGIKSEDENRIEMLQKRFDSI